MATATLHSRKTSTRAIAAAAALTLAVLAAALVLAHFIAQDVARANGCAAVRNAILRASMQCCAVEGAYPATLEYLEESYGLMVNQADYVVMYECVAENVPPVVKVELR